MTSIQEFKIRSRLCREKKLLNAYSNQVKRVEPIGEIFSAKSFELADDLRNFRQPQAKKNSQ